MLTMRFATKDYASDNDARRPRMHPSIELPPIHNTFNQQPLPPIHDAKPRELLPSMLSHSPPDRATTLPPIQGKEPWHRKDKQARPRKSSITQNNRRPKHEKSRPKDYSRRLSIDGRRAFSTEPQSAAAAAAMDKRWNDLIEAATSATEADSDRDLTPVRIQSLSRVWQEWLTLKGSPIADVSQTGIHAAVSVIGSKRTGLIQSLSSRSNSHASSAVFTYRSSAVSTD